MNNYFSEIEFKYGNSQFWFPFFFDAENRELANRKLQTYITALKKHYQITNNPNITPIFEKVNSNQLNEYVDKRLKGRVYILNTNIWEMRGMESIPELDLIENMDLLVQSGDCDSNSLAEMINQLKLPVKKLSPDFPETGNEFLLINVLR